MSDKSSEIDVNDEQESGLPSMQIYRESTISVTPCPKVNVNKVPMLWRSKNSTVHNK